jgi:dienelactone hydrolase
VNLVDLLGDARREAGLQAEAHDLIGEHATRLGKQHWGWYAFAAESCQIGSLTRHGKAHEFHRYEGAGHAFLNFTNAERYRAEPAKDAWAKMLGFLERDLRGGVAR